MEIFKYFFIVIALFFIVSCSSSYENISKNNFNFENNFSKYLFKEYKSKAKFEAEEMHDWNSAKLYSEKAILASRGIKLQPQKISYWKINSDKILDLTKAYDNLMIIYEDAIKVDPLNLAKAISSLDCWAEQQEENWQTWDISKCKKDFLSAMHKIYEKLSENKEKLEDKIKLKNTENKINNTASIITQNKEKEVLQIIYFDFDEFNLSNLSFEKIRKFIEKNKETINKYIVVGHTDTVGTKEYNQSLSLKRAYSVKNILVSQGIKEVDIKILGKGESQLKIKTNDEVPHPANRRAEISPLN
tara:strand:- start:664 stop:1569 length:906 start_codon:yes stop_codon:yes gene_type:complete